MNLTGNKVIVFMLVVMVFASQSAIAAELETTWSGLPGLIVGKQVTADLSGGGVVEGHVLSVNATQLRMNVAGSTDSRFAAKGDHAIPRSSIARLQLRESGVAGRILGTVGGVVGGFFLGGAIFDRPGQIPIGQAMAGAAAGGVGGFWLGRQLDRKRTPIRILPD